MDLAQEVGYLKGMQEATQRELTRLADAQEQMATKQDLVVLRADIVGTIDTKIDEAVTRLQGGSGPQAAAAKNQHWAIRILSSPVTPMFIAFVALLIMFLITVSALSGREASSLLPKASAPAAGDSK